MLARSLLLWTSAAALLAAPADAQASFHAMRYLDYDILGTVQAAGDFDEDGDVDLLHYFATFFAGNYAVYTNDGHARFTYGALQPVGAITGGETQEAAGVGDFNGDGHLDLALARVAAAPNTGGTTIVLVEGLGDGTFGAKFPFIPAGTVDLVAMEVHDRTGTGVPEIAFGKRLASGEVQVGWLRWNGSTFVETVSAPMAPGLFGELEVGDWGGDGELDLIVLQPNGLALRPYQSQNGVPVALPTIPLPPSIQGGAQLRALSGDFDGNGRDDVMVFDRTSLPIGAGTTEIAHFAGQPSGTLFPAGEQVLVDINPGTGIDFDYSEAAPRAVDWDGDGDLDVVHASSHPYIDDIVFLENDGGFSLSFAGSLAGVCVTAGIEDLNGDGLPDLYTGCGVYLGSGAFDMGFHESGAQNLPLVSKYDSSVDWDGDGDLDLLQLSTGALHLNDGTGQFTTTQVVLPDAPAGFAFNPLIAAGDFNADGRPDQLVPKSKEIQPGIFVPDGYHLLGGNAAGGYDDLGPAAPAKMVIATNAGDPWSAGDLNGDGFPELLVKDGFHQNVGGTLFTGFQNVFVGTPVASADVDGDGDLDVFTRDGASSSFRLQRNQGGFPFLTFTDEFLASLPETYADLSLGDLDGDGDPDALLNSSSGNQTALFENVNGSFVTGPELFDDADNSGFWILPARAVDVDGDGLTDVATVRRESHTTYGNYGDVLVVYRQVAPWKFVRDGSWWGFALNQIGDFDGDGDVDGLGALFLRNRQVGSLEGGSAQQYGAGIVGSGGIAPLLGVSGPVSLGSQPEMRLSRAVGGAPTFFAIGTAQAELVNLPLPGLVQYIDGLIDLFYWPSGGPLGANGEGSWAIPYDVNPAWAGVTFTHQVFCVDLASPSLLTATNGLAITYGQ